MPSRHYRRQLLYRSTILYPDFKYSEQSYYPIDKQLSLFQKYIFDIINIISTTFDLKLIAQKANFIIDIYNAKENTYKLIELIESSFLSTFDNIISGTSSSIIKCRIEYIRELLPKLENCDDFYSSLSPHIFKLIDSVTNGIDINIVTNNIQNFSLLLKNKYGLEDRFDEIQNIIIEIVCNIKDGVSSSIISCRVEYLKELLSEISKYQNMN
jgi:hypothetical protein